MRCWKKREESSTPSRHKPIPQAAVLIDTVIAIVLFGIGIYHFTTISSTNQSWRSGAIEFFCSTLLLTAAYCVSRNKAVVVNLVAAGFGGILGGYHLTHGGGWKSGVAELLLAAILLTAAGIIRRAKES